MSGQQQTATLKAPEGEPSPVSPATAVDPNAFSDDENAVNSPRFVSHSQQPSRGGSRSVRNRSVRVPAARDSVEDPLPTGVSTKSNRPLREGSRFNNHNNGEYDDDSDTDRYWGMSGNPDYSGGRAPRSRPPRAHLNRPQPYFNNYDAATDAKDYYEETRSYEPGDYTGRPPSRRLYDEEMAGYPRSGVAVRSNNGDTARIDWHKLSREEKAEVMRLPLTQWMNSDFKNHFVASLGELVGTTMFLFFAFAGAGVANSKIVANGSNAPADSSTAATGFNTVKLFYISTIFGFSLMVNVWIFFRISGGLFNPAVTLGMFLVKAIPASRAACLFVSQILGSMLASVIVRFLFPESFDVRTSLGGGATLVQGVFIEAILTAELVFTIFMLAKEKHRATFIAPVGIGLALFISELVGVQFTGGSLNPARSFGPCVITATFEQEHWIYWVGPALGALIAVVFYKFIKTLEYEMANPGADGDPENDPTQNPAKLAELRMSRTKSKA